MTAPRDFQKLRSEKLWAELSLPTLGPNLLYCIGSMISLFFQIYFSDYVIIFYIAELVLNYFRGYSISYVVPKHSMWTWDYIT